MELQPGVISPKGSIPTICSWLAKSICSVQWYLEESPTDDPGKQSLHNSLESQGSRDPQPCQTFYLIHVSIVFTDIYAVDISKVNQCSIHSKQRFSYVFLPLVHSKKIVTRMAKHWIQWDLLQSLERRLKNGWTQWSMRWTSNHSSSVTAEDNGCCRKELE